MRTVQSLIDEAAEVCKSRAALARRIGVHASQITCWSTGSEPISPENVALLCDVLQLSGEETRRLAALAIVANPKNLKRAEVLRRAFFVSLAAGAVGLALLTSPVEGMAETQANAQFLATLYTSCAIKTETTPTSIVGSSASNSLHTCRHRLHLTDQQSGARRPEPLHPID
jgi:DNA-binding transcriptional regulator YdaS (Cro superfamily)